MTRSIRRSIRGPSLAVLALVVPVLQGTVAYGEETSSSRLEEVIVTAAKQNRASSTGTKTDTPLIETPQAISMVTSDQLETLKVSSISDALNYMPGLVTQPSSNARYADDVTIRGFAASASSGSFLRDGLKLQSNIYDGGQEPYSLERIDVLRGASSVLYGQGSPGGVVNSVTKRPPREFLAELNAEFGDYDRKQVSGDIGGPLTDTLSARLLGVYRDSDSSVDYIPDDKRYVAGAVAWQPTDRTKLTLLTDYQTVDTRFSAPLPIAGTLIPLATGRIPQNRFVGEPDFDHYDSKGYTVGDILEHRFDDSWSAYHALRYFSGDIDIDYLQIGGVAPDNRTLLRGVSSRRDQSSGFSTDNHLMWNWAGGDWQHTALVGADFYRRRYDTHRYSGAVGTLDFLTPEYGLTTPVVNRARDNGFAIDGKQTGVYFQEQMKYRDRWVLLAGGRQDWSDNEQLSYRSGTALRQKDDAFSGRIGLVYLAPNGIAPYLNYAESFEMATGLDRAGTPFEPTFGKQYEAGLRYVPLHSTSVYTASVFQLTRSNVLTPDPVDQAFSVQTGEVRSRGIELEAKMQFAQTVNLIASYTYTDTRATESNNPTELDQRVAAVPLNTAAFWGDYVFTRFGLPGLRLGGAIRYVGSTNLPGLPVDVPGYTIVDLFGSYEWDHWRVSLNVKNVGDKDYYYCNTSFACRYGDQRSVIGMITYRN